MNKVKDYYETACEFLALSDMARCIIGTHFNVELLEFTESSENRDILIFQKVLEKEDVYAEFKKFIAAYRSNEHALYFN